MNGHHLSPTIVQEYGLLLETNKLGGLYKLYA